MSLSDFYGETLGRYKMVFTNDLKSPKTKDVLKMPKEQSIGPMTSIQIYSNVLIRAT